MSDEASKYQTVLNELFAICTGPDNKAGDRIAAAKLLLDYIRETNESGDIRVVFEGIDESFTE